MADILRDISQDPDITLHLLGNYIGSAYSPQVGVEDIEGGHRVTVMYRDAEQGITSKTFDVLDGETGPKGDDGYSPTVTITDTAYGHRVTITDASGDYSYMVPTYAAEEQARADAEDARELAEQSRVTAETERANAESSRATAESQRAVAETARVNAEQVRAIAEEGRVIAEQGRASAEVVRTSSEQARESAETARSQAESARDQAESQRAENEVLRVSAEASRASAWASIKAQVASMWGNRLTGSMSGEVLTASDAYTAPPLAVGVGGNSVQNGTPTPSAPVPIKSVENPVLTFAGKNLLPNNVTTRTIAGVTYTVNEDGTISVSGTATAAANQDIGRGITMLPAGTYTFGAGTGSGYSLFIYKIVDGTSTVLRNSPGTFTLDAETSVFMRIAINSGATVSATIRPYVYRGSTAAAFVPYKSVTIPIDLGGRSLRSLPDGTRDEVTVGADGRVTLVQRVGSVDLGTLTWTIVTTGTYRRFYSTGIVSSIVPPVDANIRANCISPNYLAESFNDVYTTRSDGIVGIVDQSSGARGNVNIVDDRYSTAADFKAGVSGVPLYYALATPVTIDLGTVSLPSMPAPDLTAWVSCTPATDIELDYERDVTIAYNNLLAAIADLATS